ncbi:antibiotic biosynthesis monooxygenase, partial [Mesorhizobium sp. M00.F.Ca.ET.186.01.1.1]
DEEAFQNWTQSEAFKRAHSGTNQNSPVKSDLRNYHVKANS